MSLKYLHTAHKNLQFVAEILIDSLEDANPEIDAKSIERFVRSYIEAETISFRVLLSRLADILEIEDTDILDS